MGVVYRETPYTSLKLSTQTEIKPWRQKDNGALALSACFNNANASITIRR